ncbi:MAG: biotin/lipoate A/B protein ligase family protein [Candidatus Edwardsbacteria bacterium]
MVWRLLDTKVKRAYENIALDEILLSAKAKNCVPNTFRFLQFSPEAVLVGFHQCVEEEVRVDFCRREKIEINRRITGGGAIFFDKTQLGWEIIANKNDLKISSFPLEKFFAYLCKPIVQTLREYGLNASFRGKNDIEIEGRKISGTGGTEDGNAFLFQGTILLALDLERMVKALRLPIEKLKNKEINSIKERVTWIKRELGYLPPLEEIKGKITRNFERTFKVKLEKASLIPEEEKLFREKKSFFRSKSWIEKIKRPLPLKRRLFCSSYKRKGGLIKVSMILERNGQQIQSLFLSGDFFAYPQRSIYDLEAMLKGARACEKTIRSLLTDYFARHQVSIPGLSAFDFAEAISLALQKREYLKYHLPLRSINSVFPVCGRFEEIIQKKPKVLLLPYCAKLKDCQWRYKKGCSLCGKCSVGKAYQIGLKKKMHIESIINFEDLERTLKKIKHQGEQAPHSAKYTGGSAFGGKYGEPAFIGCCCEPFYVKHQPDFERIGLPGILIDVENDSCYDLGKATEGHQGDFQGQTEINLPLLNGIVALTTKESG